MPKISRTLAATVILATLAATALAVTRHGLGRAADDAAVTATTQPVLAVAATTLQPITLPVRLGASGNIMAWQEASIGTEADGLRLTTVRANVGDVVRHGELLATFAADTIKAQLAQDRATLAEAEALFAEARDTARRARELQSSGALSAQHIHRAMIAERTAGARLAAARAAEQKQRLRLAQTRVLAPGDGVISARSASVGAVLPAGQELFRLIRHGRLEWRAEVAASDLAKLKPGQVVRLTPVGGETIEGRIRALAPWVDLRTRNGLAYVDLPAGTSAQAGMFARGEFEIGAGQALTLPQTAVLLRDGFSYVMCIGADARVIRTKVSVGRRAGDRIEITAGIDTSARVVASGGAFLSDGDPVLVLDDPSAGH
ncbi:MAG: efflux RND transporter periplasmic adaptor subunit [Zoogloea sp.]|nr:efflux RND transporter periplasmic adaptor subunit [Zoogloea sp.]